MKVDAKKSADIIDRRRFAIASVLTGILALVAVLLGRQSAQKPDPEDQLVHVVSTALDRGQAFWAQSIDDYRRAKVVLYRQVTSTACGRGFATFGPFYCGRDERIYVDLGFFARIENNLARAYVIAHELGHHVQKLRGELDHRPTIEVELGADCYAGQWMLAEQVAGRLEQGDINAAIAEASAIGDDKICPSCSPESWSHGSSDQRTRAVYTGLAGYPCLRYQPASPAERDPP